MRFARRCQPARAGAGHAPPAAAFAAGWPRRGAPPPPPTGARTSTISEIPSPSEMAWLKRRPPVTAPIVAPSAPLAVPSIRTCGLRPRVRLRRPAEALERRSVGGKLVLTAALVDGEHRVEERVLLALIRDVGGGLSVVLV